MAVGVLSIQGDFEKHLEAFSRLGHPTVEVRTSEDLSKVDRLVIPGGESTTVGLLLHRFGLGTEIIDRAEAGMPIWGTCMGMIMLATEIENRPTQYSLGLLDVTIRRNAFGAQVFSFEDKVEMQPFEEPITGVFIRAPIVVRTGPKVEILAKYEEKIVAVRQGNLIGTSFHPELTHDDRVHSWFMTV